MAHAIEEAALVSPARRRRAGGSADVGERGDGANLADRECRSSP
jgi:hypothetical protein